MQLQLKRLTRQSRGNSAPILKGNLKITKEQLLPRKKYISKKEETYNNQGVKKNQYKHTGQISPTSINSTCNIKH